VKQDISFVQLAWRKHCSAELYQMQNQEEILCLTYTGFHHFNFPWRYKNEVLPVERGTNKPGYGVVVIY
jgi:hypothetical protein